MQVELLKVNKKESATISIDGKSHIVPFSNLSEVKEGDVIMTDTIIGVKVLKVKKYNTYKPFNGIDYDIHMTCEHFLGDVEYDRHFQFLKPNYKLLILNDYITTRYTYNELLEKVNQLENEIQLIKRNKEVQYV